MASSAVSAYNSGSASGSRENAASQNAAERTTFRSASPFVRAYKDDGASNSAQNPDKSATYTTFPDAKGLSEQRGDADGSTSAYGTKRSTYDFHAVLRKYNIRLDEAPSEPPKTNGQARLDDKPKQNGSPNTSQAQSTQQTPLNDASSRWTLRNNSQTPNNVSSVNGSQNAYDYPTTTAKYDSAKSDYLRRGSDEPPESSYAFETGLENRVVNRSYYSVDATQRTTQAPAATSPTPAYAMPNSISNSSIPYVNAKYEAPSATATVSATHSDTATIIALRRQLAERDAECSALRRQLEDERERLRRSQAALAAATSAAASAAAAASQPDPTTAARLIELETMRDRYEELLAEKTSLEETVDRLRSELEGTSASRTTAVPQYSLARRYAPENLVQNGEDENYGAVGGLLTSQRRAKTFESRPRDLQLAPEPATYGAQRGDVGDYRHERQRSSSLMRNSQSDEPDAFAGDSWRNEAQTLRERNRMMTDENTVLRAQLLAAKRPPATSTSTASNVEVETMRYYETQVADAREMVRKLQTQGNYAQPRTQAAAGFKLEQAATGLPPRAPRLNESLASAETQARRADAYVWRPQDPRSPSPTRPLVDNSASRATLDLHASARSPSPARFVPNDAPYAHAGSDYPPAPSAASNSSLSVASVTANITRLLDRSNAALAQSRSAAPIKATAPPTLVAGAGAAFPTQPPATTGFAYRQLVEDTASRKSRLSSSETQLGTANSSAYFGASKYTLQNGAAAQPQSYPAPSAERRALTNSNLAEHQHRASTLAAPAGTAGTASTRTNDYLSSRPYMALRLPSDLR